MYDRWTRNFSSDVTFPDDLGAIGAWVGPRQGVGKRTQDQKEDYALRRLLVAWRRLGLLPFPFTVEAASTGKGYPDFSLSLEINQKLGIEVTEAGSEAWQAKLSAIERAGADGGTEDDPVRRGSGQIAEEVLPYGSKRKVADEIRAAIEKKSKMADGDGWYVNSNSGVQNCDLLVYENTSGFERITGKDLGAFREFEIKTPFRQVHLISGHFVHTNVLDAAPRSVDVSQDYNIDFAEWVAGQVELLREGRLEDLDHQAIMEELTALAKSDRRALRSHLRVLLHHLLKLRHQPGAANRSWKSSINNARTEIEELLAGSPSLRRELECDGDGRESGISSAYRKARKSASIETGIELETLPESCPFALDQILDDDFFG